MNDSELKLDIASFVTPVESFSDNLTEEVMRTVHERLATINEDNARIAMLKFQKAHIEKLEKKIKILQGTIKKLEREK